MPDCALFVDWENIRFTSLHEYRQEPDIPALIELAREHGSIAAAFAYADFSEHPDWVRRQLDVAGITIRDVPLRRMTRNGVERVRSSADLHMIVDIVETALDRPNVETYLLATGDADFIRITTWLRNRFGRKVVIVGVPGSISRDLVRAAGHSAPLPVGRAEPASDEEIARRIIAMIATKSPPLGFWTLKLIHQWANDPRNAIPGTSAQKYDVIGALRDRGVLEQEEQVRDGRTVRITRLNYQHPEVQEQVGREGA